MATCTIHKDGSVDITLATQDIGPGARTVALVVTSKTLGFLPLDKIRVEIGDTSFPPSGTSGGSGTTGQVSGQVGNAVRQARQQLLDLVAPTLNVPSAQLEVSLGRVQPKGRPEGGMAWGDACAKIGDALIAVAPSGVDWNRPLYPPQEKVA
jgi:xanthine dehydrogenase YagR molybdenum-binding subunit